MFQSLLRMRKLLTADAFFACWPCFGHDLGHITCWLLLLLLVADTIIAQQQHQQLHKKHDHCGSTHVFVGCCLSRCRAGP
jgi:hypothetical protein